MKQKILLCTDLDRTLLPNGPQPESPLARPLFGALADSPEITLAYVSGRSRELLQKAMAEYALPLPDYAVGDVGSTIYRLAGEDWRPMQSWNERIAPDWRGYPQRSLADWIGDFSDLRLQEAERQNEFKLSYYTGIDVEWRDLIARIESRLRERDVHASVVWSRDEAAGVGLLDILPASASKLHAVQFLAEEAGIPETGVLFAGDSGNDLPVMASGLQSVLVANADQDTRDEARAASLANGLEDQLYVAKGGFLGMNGNYAAGILEGLQHFFPDTAVWMKELAARL